MRRSPPALLPLAAALAAALTAASTTSRAQDRPTLSGTWTASALSEQWTLSSWGDACGPKPRGQGAGGGSVQIKQHGAELMISGAGRAWSTTDCWEQMPGLSRTSHSASGGGRAWRTRCASAANDPRRASVVTTTQATDTTITMSETGQYQFVINDTTCSASVTRSRSYSLVRREDAAPAASASASAPPASASAPPPPAPAPAATEAKPAMPKSCASPGEAARLEVSPSRKLMRPGERFQFRAVVMDAEGCALSARPTWSIAPGPLAAHASVDPGGALAIAADAAEGEIGLTAAVGGKGVTVRVEVAAAERYDALLESRGLGPSGESDQAAVAVIATGTLGGRTAVGEDGARERKQAFVAIVIALAACLGLAGLILLRRGHRRTAAPAAEPGPDSDMSPSSAPSPSTSSTSSEAPAAPAPEPVREPAPPKPAAPRAAPPPTAAAARPTPKRRGKICPTCGEHYPNEALFCGKDGTQLVLIN